MTPLERNSIILETNMIEHLLQGYTIRVGENQLENDTLLRSSEADDVWAHVSGKPSAHAVISNPTGKKVPRQVIKRACCIIKSRSSSRSDKNVVFDVTRVKNVALSDVPGLVSIIGASQVTI